MNIGFDITELYVAQAGVFYYRYNLLQALLRLEPQEHHYRLIDYYPIHGGWAERPEVDRLTSSQAETRHIHGLRHRKLARLKHFQKPGLLQVAQGIDAVLLAPWGNRAQRVMGEKLTQELQGVDVFHTSDVLNFAPPDVKTITTIHDMTTLLFPEYHTRETIELQQAKFRFAREEADAIIAVSESTKRDIVRLIDIEPERIHVVYEGVASEFQPLPEVAIQTTIAKWDLKPNGYILHVGTIEPRKNLVRLVKAYYEVWRKRPLSTPKLVLAGAAGWFYKDVFAVIKELGLIDKVIFAGRVDDTDLPALYNGALFFVYPSLYEGFGIPPLEAMTCGTAVLVSHASSLPEVVGEAGHFINPQNIDSISNGLKTLINDTKYRQALANKGKMQAQLFSWEIAAQQTLVIYEGVTHA